MNDESLVIDNMNLVYFIVNKYYPSYIADEDLKQVGMLGLCNAANTWDESKSKFSTYASSCILNEIKSEFKQRHKYKYDLSLDKEMTTSEGQCTFGDYIMGDEDIDYINVEDFTDNLNKTEQEVFELSCKGYSTHDSAKVLNCSDTNIRKIKRNIKLKWRKYNGND